MMITKEFDKILDHSFQQPISNCTKSMQNTQSWLVVKRLISYQFMERYVNILTLFSCPQKQWLYLQDPYFLWNQTTENKNVQIIHMNSYNREMNNHKIYFSLSVCIVVQIHIKKAAIVVINLFNHRLISSNQEFDPAISW